MTDAGVIMMNRGDGAALWRAQGWRGLACGTLLGGLLAVAEPSAALAQDAPAAETAALSIDEQGWTGGAFGDEQTQSFSHCAVNRPFDNGVTVIVSMNAEGSANIAFGNTDWDMDPQSEGVAGLSIDGTVARQLGGVSGNATVFVVPLGPDDEFIEALRRGLTLTVQIPPGQFEIPLTGTAASLRQLRDCVEVATALIAENPELVEPPEPREVPAMSLDALANILDAAGIAELQFLAPERVPLNDMQLRFVWRSGPMIGGLHQSPRRSAVEVGGFARTYMDIMEAFCPTRFEPQFGEVDVLGDTYGFASAELICGEDNGDENFLSFFFALDDFNYSVFFHQAPLPLADDAVEATDAVQTVVLSLAQSVATTADDEDAEPAGDGG